LCSVHAINNALDFKLPIQADVDKEVVKLGPKHGRATGKYSTYYSIAQSCAKNRITPSEIWREKSHVARKTKVWALHYVGLPFKT